MGQNEALAAGALKIATSNIGQRESTGHNDGKFVNGLQDWLGGKPEEGAPWCAIFRSWCMAQAAQLLPNEPLTPRTDSSTELYNFGKKNNLLCTPIPGCTGLVRGGYPDKSHHHTFVVVSVDLESGVVQSIDGNWGNSVCRTSHRISDCDFIFCV